MIELFNTVDDLEQRAAAFAAYKHGLKNQRRKYTGEPYICHPAAVANILRERGGCHEVLYAAAWCHDVLEDTDTTFGELRDVLGRDVAELVFYVTNESRPQDGNRATRKAIDLKKLHRAPPVAKTLKLADLIDNSRSILARDPKFAKVYLKEKADLLDVLQEGDNVLWARAYTILNDGLLELGMAP